MENNINIMEKVSRGNCIIVYGAGEYFSRIQNQLEQRLKISYIHDRNLEIKGQKQYGTFPVLTYKELLRKKDALIVIAVEKPWLVEEIEEDLAEAGLSFVRAKEIVGIDEIIITSELLKRKYPFGEYNDERGNKLYFNGRIPENINIELLGENNEVCFGKNISVVDNLRVRLGNNGCCKIGDGTEIGKADILISESKVEIGRDCLFSSNVMLRAHDNHQIFSMDTWKKINYPRDIIIGDQVWIGHQAVLLGGAEIGNGSVVGTGCITSSVFDDHVIIAGIPGKVIRERIFWSKDNVEYFNWDTFDQCIDQKALQYLAK